MHAPTNETKWSLRHFGDLWRLRSTWWVMVRCQRTERVISPISRRWFVVRQIRSSITATTITTTRAFSTRQNGRYKRHCSALAELSWIVSEDKRLSARWWITYLSSLWNLVEPSTRTAVQRLPHCVWRRTSKHDQHTSRRSTFARFPPSMGPRHNEPRWRRLLSEEWWRLQTPSRRRWLLHHFGNVGWRGRWTSVLGGEIERWSEGKRRFVRLRRLLARSKGSAKRFAPCWDCKRPSKILSTNVLKTVPLHSPSYPTPFCVLFSFLTTGGTEVCCGGKLDKVQTSARELVCLSGVMVRCSRQRAVLATCYSRFATKMVPASPVRSIHQGDRGLRPSRCTPQPGDAEPSGIAERWKKSHNFIYYKNLK